MKFKAVVLFLKLQLKISFLVPNPFISSASYMR